MRARARSLTTALALTATLGLALAGCAGTDAPGTGDEAGKTVTLVVHDSFVDGEAFGKAASAATGYEVEVITAGDGGELTNKLVLTKGAPIADAFFGVDNSFASRLIEHGVVQPFTPDRLPARAADLLSDLDSGDGSGSAGGGDAADSGADGAVAVPMVPIDLGATCINIDTAWFSERGVTPPKTYDDLTDPRYKGLTVLIDPTASSTGAAFLIGTVAEFGEQGFGDYWSKLMKNDARIESGWSEAYNGRFTQGGGEGKYPIVLSYSTSPAWTLSDDGSTSTTEALLDTCTTQVEYAGVLAGAANPKGAEAVVDYLLSREFQDTIAETMYMYPVDPEATLPEEWQRFAAMPTAPHDLSPSQIDSGRERWLKAWSEAVGE